MERRKDREFVVVLVLVVQVDLDGDDDDDDNARWNIAVCCVVASVLPPSLTPCVCVCM